MFKRSNSQIHFYDKDKKSQENKRKADNTSNISTATGKFLKINDLNPGDTEIEGNKSLSGNKASIQTKLRQSNS